MDSAQVFLQLTCALLVAAMLMNTLRTLRMFALAAGLSAVLYFELSRQPGFTLIWASLFVLANAAQLARLVHGSRLSKMRPEERALLEDILRVDDPAQQRRLIGLLNWRDADVGTVLIRQGQPHPPLIYVASGAAGIELDGQLVGVCGAGDFLGDISIATGQPASAAVVVSNPMRIAVVDRAALAQLAQAAPEIGAAFDAALNRGLAAKVLRMNEAAAAS
jgi:CRP-like cAMP-binding protein